MLDISQERLAAAAGVSRGHIAAIETGRINPSLDLVERIGGALGLDIHLASRALIVVEPPRQRDLVHARCSSYAERRFGGDWWETAREARVVDGRWRGWIDILAFDHRTRTLVIVEIKTQIDDMGAIERQVGTYERAAMGVTASLGWRPRRICSWLVALASDDVEQAARANRDLLARAFPRRAADMRRILDRDTPTTAAGGTDRGFALIDPRSRRRDWLIPSRLDGRRSAAPYRDYADAARRLAIS